MELNFGENIKRLRKSRDLTQEALADALGISAQSVSKWECAYGYPDITQLPAIANFFGVTIDELLSNDKDGRESVREKFTEKFNDFILASDEQIEFAREYCRRYPNDLDFCMYLCCALSQNIVIYPENKAKYLSLLRNTVEKLLESPEHRNHALYNMITACDKEEVEQYLEFAPYSVEYTRRNLLISRYESINDCDKQLIHQGLAFIENMIHHLDIRYPDSLGPERKFEYHKCILSVVRSFSGDGNVPDGWLAFYGYKQLVLAACLFENGKQEEGKAEFLSAIEKLRHLYHITDEFLDMGGILFGNLKINKDWNMAIDSHGEKHKLYDTHELGIFSSPAYIYSLLTEHCWEWFNSARNEDYYREAVEWLKALTEKNAQ